MSKNDPIDKVLEPLEKDEDISKNSLDSLISIGEWEKLYIHHEYQKMARSTKIVTLHKAMRVREAELVKMFYEIVSVNPSRGGEFLNKKVKRIRFLMEFLKDCLMWEQMGEIPTDVPKELRNHL